MSTPLLQVQDLHAGYGRAEVLTGLAFELPKGQVVTVIGPNGAGKSTTLNALMGLLPARGRILFDGEDLAIDDAVPIAIGLRAQIEAVPHGGLEIVLHQPFREQMRLGERAPDLFRRMGEIAFDDHGFCFGVH